jgi:hypothetical protein
MQLERSTPLGYLLQLPKKKEVAAELPGLQRVPQRRARHLPSHRALSTNEPRTHQPLYAVRNAPLPVIAITPPEQYVETWAAKVAE